MIATLLPRSSTAAARQSATIANDWVLTWSDEFNSPDGSTPDPKKWSLQTGGGGWGNNELEYYTARRENSRIENGNLVIEARKDKFTGPDGVTRDFTSARMKTAGLFSQKYGRFEARIKIPRGQGMWPAFWMLGDDIATVGWPRCGEIDIMENVGNAPWTVVGSLHGPGYSGGNPLHDSYILPNKNFADDFHIFAVEWGPAAIRFFVDDHLYQTLTPDDRPTGTTWVFDHPFFLILNVAVGGNWPGPPDESTQLPQRMLVDYVRVYKRK
ncbi:MAG TPA: glycoside hydrolase family 16 protein [Candidatus Eisenbacteria bacterium]|nr:glycoside hydrolase family 16 protein [Candidatus Eisenbacteria bacterium]